MSLMRAIATVGGFTLLSRLTGFARDMMVAGYLGAGPVADCFFVAFKFPNLFRRLFAEGAFSAAFVPMFAASLERDGKDEARAFASGVFSILALVLALFSAVMMIIMPWAMWVFAPGFGDVPGKQELAVELTRITFPYLLFISLCSLLSGVLNGLGRFAAAAGTPVLLNLVLMASLPLLTPFTATAGHALAWGVSAAGVVQFLWLCLSARKAGLLPRLVRPRWNDKVRTLVLRILPVAFGAGLYQISLLIDTMLASLLPDGSVSYLYYADRVNQLPLGVVGIAIGTALLPLLSRQIAAGDAQGSSDSQNRSIEFALLLTLPAMAALMVLAGPIVETLFQRGAFSAADAAATAAALAAFSLGLPGYVLVKVFTPGFFAREDTKTPVRVAAAALAVNVALNLALMPVIAHVGIALATALASLLNAGLLGVILVRRGHYAWDDRLRRRLPRLLAAVGILAAALAALRWAAERYLPDLPGLLGTEVKGWALLVVYVGVGAVVYGLAAFGLGAVSRADLGRLRRKKAA